VTLARPRKEGLWTFGVGEEVVGDGEPGDGSSEYGFDLLADGFDRHFVAALGEDFDDGAADSADLRRPSDQPLVVFISRRSWSSSRPMREWERRFDRGRERFENCPLRPVSEAAARQRRAVVRRPGRV
jgi:hypothetical protein